MMSSSPITPRLNKLLLCPPRFYVATLQPYRSVVVNLNLSEKSTRPDIAYVAYQCACFFQDPMSSHRDKIIHLVKYLKTTKTQGITLDPKGNKSFEVYANAKLCGN